MTLCQRKCVSLNTTHLPAGYSDYWRIALRLQNNATLQVVIGGRVSCMATAVEPRGFRVQEQLEGHELCKMLFRQHRGAGRVLRPKDWGTMGK